MVGFSSTANPRYTRYHSLPTKSYLGMVSVVDAAILTPPEILVPRGAVNSPLIVSLLPVPVVDVRLYPLEYQEQLS